MLGFEITEQPPSEVVVDEMFTFAFNCPYTSRSFSDVLKKFTPNNSFATAKLVDLPTLEDIEDETYTMGSLRAQFSDDISDRILRFEIGIRKPGSYKVLISIHGKTSDWNTSVHYPVISDLWTDEIYVKEQEVPQPAAQGLPHLHRAVLPHFNSYRLFLEENQNSRVLASEEVEEPEAEPTAEDLPHLHRAEIAPIRTSESLVVEDGTEDHNTIPIGILKAGLPPAYYRIIMEAPLSSYQRTFLIEAMTAVNAYKHRDSLNEETEDSIGDEDEGVQLSQMELDDRGLIGPAGATSPIEW